MKRDGSFIKYGPDDFTPGHSEVCSFQLSDPAKCPVCKHRKSKPLILVAGACLAVASCATPATRTQTVEVKVPVAVQPIKPEQVPTVPAPLGPRPESASAAADILLADHCKWVAYGLLTDPLLRVSAGEAPKALPKYPECER
jgi:hypothetical protein